MPDTRIKRKYASGMMYDIRLDNALTAGSAPQEIVNANGFSSVIAGYSSSSINLTNKLLMNIGVNGQVFTLNNHYTIEPRLGFLQQLSKNKSIGAQLMDCTAVWKS